MILKFWFKNGICIEKIIPDNTANMTNDEQLELAQRLVLVNNVIKKSFEEPGIGHASVTIEGIVIRVDELIAFDIVEEEKK